MTNFLFFCFFFVAAIIFVVREKVSGKIIINHVLELRMNNVAGR